MIAAQAIVPAPAGHAPRPEAALAAANYRRFEDAREAQPGSVPWQHLLQPWQHRETTWDRLRHAEAAAGQDGAEAEAGA